MAIRFNADEVLQVAQQIERNGARFYRYVAELRTDPRTQNTLLELAAWEDRHYEVFAGMRARLSPEQREETVFDPDQELPLYLRSLADRRVFDIYADPVGKLSGQETVRDLLELALGFEKDSVVFYVGVKDMVPPALSRERVEEIIREEMTHLSIIGGRLKAAEAE